MAKIWITQTVVLAISFAGCNGGDKKGDSKADPDAGEDLSRSDDNVTDFEREGSDVIMAKFRARELGLNIFKKDGIEVIVFPAGMFGWQEIRHLLFQVPEFISKEDINIEKLEPTDPDKELVSNNLNRAVDLIKINRPDFVFDPKLYVVQTLALQNIDDQSKFILYNFIKERGRVSVYLYGDFLRSYDTELNIRVFVKLTPEK